MFENQRELATKTFYATVGAPVVIARSVRETSGKVADRVTEYGDKLTAGASAQIDDFAKEGEKVTKQLQGNTVVEELQSRVDLEKVQDRVEKLRDQLDGALQSWRESFTPEGAKTGAEKVPVEKDEKGPVSKATAKKAPASKATTTRKTPAKKAPTAKTPASKTTPTKKASTKKAPAKKTPAKTAG